MNKMILVRGVSGCGKSTFAEFIAGMAEDDDLDVLSIAADEYYTQYDGAGNMIAYNWSAEKQHDAHKWCQACVINAAQTDCDLIIVHNTFTTNKQMKPYFKIAKDYGYDVTTLIVENRRGSSNLHDVPEEALQRQETNLRNNIVLR